MALCIAIALFVITVALSIIILFRRTIIFTFRSGHHCS